MKVDTPRGVTAVSFQLYGVYVTDGPLKARFKVIKRDEAHIYVRHANERGWVYGSVMQRIIRYTDKGVEYVQMYPKPVPMRIYADSIPESGQSA